MTRRPKGRIFLRPCAATWSIVYDLPRREPGGKRRRKVVGGFRSPLAARTALDAALAALASASVAEPDGAPVPLPEPEYLVSEPDWSSDLRLVPHANALLAGLRCGLAVDMAYWLARQLHRCGIHPEQASEIVQQRFAPEDGWLHPLAYAWGDPN